MAAEIAEIPAVIERQLDRNLDTYLSLGRDWAASPPPFFATCARGSSDQAATFFKYLTEIGAGIPVTSLGPSVGSVFQAPVKLRGAAFLAISQSGASPDIVALTRAASQGGAQTVALLNTIDSPLAKVADRVVPLGAGTEHAVAATKSFVVSLVALACIHAGQAGDQALVAGIRALPEWLRARSASWSCDLTPLTRKRRLFCLGRGLGLALAGEAALKFKETCLLAAEGFSAAEFRHGPIALADSETGALAFLLDDAARAGTESLIDDLRRSGVEVVTVDGGELAGKNPPKHPAVQAIAAIAIFYRAIHQLSVSLGLDPDLPPNLIKATFTK
jgi:glucosamine--fructose-6-phosphate aminotransferase (isomerizing)